MTQSDPSSGGDLKMTPDANHESQTADVIKKLLLAVKNSTLYPPGHDVPVSCIKDLYAGIQPYLEQQHQQLVVTVDKNRLVSGGRVFHEGRLHSDNIAFLLHRDGIQWISWK